MTSNDLIRGALFALGGAGLCALNLATLRYSVPRIIHGDVGRQIALHALRLVLVVAVLAWTARQGAAPLIGLGVGFMLARPLVMRLLAPTP